MIMSTVPFQNFQAYYSKLEAFYIETCIAENDLKSPIKQLSRELALVQLIAIADAYRVDIMHLAFRSNHHFLRNSKEKMSHVDILSLGDWQSIYYNVIRLEVDIWTRIAYESWITKLKSERILPNLSIGSTDILQMEEIIALRNILIHNKGVVDGEYIRRSKNWYNFTKCLSPKEGETIIIDDKYYKEAALCLLRIVKKIDEEMAKII